MNRKILLPAGALIIIVLGVIAVYSFMPETAPAEDENISVVAENLDVPWGIEFLPNGDMLVTERSGTLLRIERTNTKFRQRYNVEGVEHRGEGGLLGVATHPNYEENNWVYLYMTTRDGDMLRNRVVRYTLEDNQLSNPTAIIENLPGAIYHDGGRIDFGPDGKLYITAGDATNPEWAQQKDVFAGKILRLNSDGSVPADNPFNNPVYSYGHRNPQGLTWIGDRLYATEHGDQRHDELNRIVKGGNYGWPVIEASQTRQGMRTPLIYADSVTWAPAGAASIDSTIYFAGLRGNGLYRTRIENDEASQPEKFLTEYGRLRAVEVGPDGDLYVSTSNTDGRGVPASNDDKILKVDPSILG